MVPIKYWDVWTWIMLICALYNTVAFVGSLAALSLLGMFFNGALAGLLGYAFWKSVKR